jgi:tungstate transport system substrate-binding protein
MRGWVLASLLLCVSSFVRAEEPRFIVVQSTTSTQDSGLFDVILPRFTRETGIEVRVVAVGTGQALKNAANGDGDVLLVHSRADEEAFVANGNGVARFDLMYNDFVLIGPAADPAAVRGSTDVVAALRRIATALQPFVSRGDDSGTHKRERQLWQETGVDVTAASGTWYRETGSGMGATLNTAVGMGAYTLSDRASWASFRNQAGHVVMVEGDARLRNQYGIILVNPQRHPRVRAAEGQRFIDWLLGPTGQAAIAAVRVNGQQLYIPNAP